MREQANAGDGASARPEIESRHVCVGHDDSAARGPGRVVDELTPQELQVATLAAAGLANKEAAARLFLSVKTIEAHMHRTYRKLGVRSRAELAPLLAEQDLSASNGSGRA